MGEFLDKTGRAFQSLTTEGRKDCNIVECQHGYFANSQRFLDCMKKLDRLDQELTMSNNLVKFC